MRRDKTTHPGHRSLLTLAAFVICVAGLKAAGPIILPVLMAGFLALVCLPAKRRLEDFGIPSALAIGLVLAAAVIAISLLVGLVHRSALEFAVKFPAYEERVESYIGDVRGWLVSVGVDPSGDQTLDGARVVDMAKRGAGGLAATLSNVLFVVLTMCFILAEAHGFPRKMSHALGGDPDNMRNLAEAVEKVQTYLAIKAVLSAATGLLVWLLCLSFGVDFALLWAVLAFTLNFIPNIGSVIAAVPAVLIAFVESGLGVGIGVGIGYIVINMVIGNVIEPRWLGEKLGLSALVVFLSMVFWGWIWGPFGMFLSVPLTVLTKIICDHTRDFRWLGILLGPTRHAPTGSRRRRET